MAKDKYSWGLTIRTIVFSILLGGASGILATAMTTNYLSNYAIQLGELTTPLRLAQERPRALPGSFEEAVTTTRERMFPATAQFYPAVSGSQLQAYTPDDALFQGVVLTSDGWLLTAGEPANGWGQVRLFVDGELYTIEEAVHDPVSEVTFIHIDTDDLPVLSFGNSLGISSGDQLFGIAGPEALSATALFVNHFGDDAVRSADAPTRRLVLDTQRTFAVGSPVANVVGELVGVVVLSPEETEESIVYPLDTILPSFRALLRDGTVSRPYLGVDVIDISHTAGLEVRTEQGALIPSANAIAVDSPAAAAGLRADDIILAVDGQLVNSRRTLDEILMTYQAGAQVNLTIDRGGEEQVLTAQLETHPAFLTQ